MSKFYLSNLSAADVTELFRQSLRPTASELVQQKNSLLLEAAAGNKMSQLILEKLQSQERSALGADVVHPKQ